ncbi:MAG: alpha-amylase family glycosyl hydrolase [Anaerolineales bacterium]
MKRIIPILLIFALLAACAPSAANSPQTASPTPAATATLQPPSLPWWREAVFYEIFVRSFSDSNGDGIGDFNGITQRLDYLQSLGVTALWLMPINPSPSYHGYDVLNYYAVNPQYGTMADFQRLLAEAHRRDMRVIMDLVLNHTSNQHPFFVAANSDVNSPYRNFYRWAETYPGTHWHSGQNGFYYGFFSDRMPDLNYTNPQVTAQMEQMSAFWLKMGVDGFRIDAAKHLVEEGEKFENTAANHAWLKGYYAAIKNDFPNAYTLGEIYGAGALVTKIYQNELDHIFNFEVASGAVNSALGQANSGINSAITFALKDNPGGDFATFLTNHDQERAMSTLRGDTAKAKVAAALLLTAPGTPFLYYGEEIGMTGKKPDENLRTPMQWDASPNAGFTSGSPWMEINADAASGTNVEAQQADPNSLWKTYQALIALRRAHPALSRGDTFLPESANHGVYALIRRDAFSGETILVLVNLTGQPVSEYALSVSGLPLPDGETAPQTLFGGENAAPLKISGGGFQSWQPLASLPAQGIFIFQLSH